MPRVRCCRPTLGPEKAAAAAELHGLEQEVPVVGLHDLEQEVPVVELHGLEQEVPAVEVGRYDFRDAVSSVSVPSHWITRRRIMRVKPWNKLLSTSNTALPRVQLQSQQLCLNLAHSPRH